MWANDITILDANDNCVIIITCVPYIERFWKSVKSVIIVIFSL